MRKLLIKVPTVFFFLGLIAGPLISIFLKLTHSIHYTRTNLFLLDVMHWGVIIIWISSLVNYFSFQGKSNKNDRVIISLIIVTGIASLLENNILYSWTLYGLSIVSYIFSVILIVQKIKRVFYARSTWFIVIELLALPVGFLTLTPEIKRHEKALKEDIK